MKKVNVDFKDGALAVGLDSNSDGQNSVTLKANLKEVYSELLEKGEAKIECKSLTVKLVGAELKLLVDTDKDGEAVLELDVSLPETFEEATSLGA